MMLKEFNNIKIVSPLIALNNMTLRNASNFTTVSPFNITDEFDLLQEPLWQRESAWLYILLIIWVATLAIEELKQLYHIKKKAKYYGKTKLKNAFYEYISYFWNKIDIAGILFFFIGIILRLMAKETDEDIFISSKFV